MLYCSASLSRSPPRWSMVCLLSDGKDEWLDARRADHLPKRSCREIPSVFSFVRLESNYWCALPGVLQGRMKVDPKLSATMELHDLVWYLDSLRPPTFLLQHKPYCCLLACPFRSTVFHLWEKLRAKEEMGVWTTSAWRNTGRRLSLYRPCTAPMYGLSRLGSASRGVGRYVAGMTIGEGETT
jgi:hypothetical protein